jgi:methylated-DNA-[protein]-cysteine S-methyltransferase
MKKKPRQSTIISEFSSKVYRAVSEIPESQVRTYKQIAEAIGAPRAYRAVGNALNKNPFMGSVPCHRVIRSDGNIGGFVKGAHIKQRLLRQEASKRSLSTNTCA